MRISDLTTSVRDASSLRRRSGSSHFTLARLLVLLWMAPGWEDFISRIVSLSTVFFFLMVTSANAQDSQFLFDATGNLFVQTPASALPPQIIRQPQMQVVQPGALATFSVVALNTSGLSYQWLFNGTNLDGQTSDALQISNVSSNNQGYYSVLLVNSFGSITSSPAPLWIDSRGCGMPDWWQLQYFGNLNQNATADFDGDSVSNLQEFLDGTNPTNSASVRFHLTLFSDGGVVQVVPNQSGYNTGDVVTLTATTTAPGAFHAWLGDVISRSNSVSLVMTTNKTVFARFTPIDFIWTNSNGDWSGPANWSPPLVPLGNDNAYLNVGGTITQSNMAECLNLVMGANYTSPTLSLSNTFTVHGQAVWASGQFSGTGRVFIDTSASMVITNEGIFSAGVNLNAVTLENGGTILFTGAGSIGGNGGVITNRAGALFENQGVGSLAGFAGNYRFDNAGVVRKTVSPGTNSTAIQFNNYGIVDIETGTFVCGGTFTNTGTVTLAPAATNRFGVSSAFSSGPFNTPAGALVELNSGALTLAAGAQLNGSGLYRINGGTMVANTDLSVSNFDLGNVALDGSGTVTISNVMNWTAGSMIGTGRTVIPPGATLNISNVGNINLSRTLENCATVLWTGPGTLTFSSGILTNRAGAIFEQQGAGSFAAFNFPYRFDNSGIFQKTLDPGTNNVRVDFNNYGTVDIEAGTVTWNSSFTNIGIVTLAPGATNRFTVSSALSSGPFNVPIGALVEIDSGMLLLVPGAQLNGPGLYRINSTGNLAANTDVVIQNLDLIATLSGAGLVTVSNVLNWLGGGMTGTGHTLIGPGALLSESSATDVTLTRVLENGGTILCTNSGGFYGSGGVGILTNRAGALVDIRNDVSFRIGLNSCRFDNAGIFRKSASIGTNTFAAGFTFNNYGAVDIQSGTVQCNDVMVNNGSVTLAPGTTNRMVGGGSATGSFTAPAGALVEFSGGSFTLNPGAQLNGPGLYNVTSGSLTINTDIAIQNLNLSAGLFGSGIVTVTNVMNWTAGSMSGVGRTVIGPSATLNFNSASDATLTRVLENAGTALCTGNGGFYGAAGAAIITNRPGALFEVRNNASFTHGLASCRIDNAGTFRKSFSVGTNTFDGAFAFNNYGTVDVQSGTLAANGGYVSTSAALLNSAIGGTVPGTNFGRLQVAGALTVNGALNVALVNGYLPTTNDSFAVVTAGTRSGSFSSFSFPSNQVAMLLSNTASAVIVHVTGVTAPPPAPLLLTPLLSGTNVLLTWTTVSNVLYRLEFNPDLTPSNWTALPGDVLSSSTNASKLDPLTPSNRFYRVRVLP